ncbi:hypothetical protein GH714_043972 [Hevea brasiliensis]|uniref:Uncharacterized protein n=1 Tax=Hevea brasiliensis TaxID=3981 RepID=A0A6A6K248_HEVBR|nr:hypothetical protein GH714_043972 [Hevea brasiliensis]
MAARGSVEGLQPPIAVAIIAEDSAFGPTASEERTGGQDPPPHPARARGLGRRLRDTQADVPSAGWLRAQLAFKDSMVRGILQFTSIAFCCVLHRCESRDIRCRESLWAAESRQGEAQPASPTFGRRGTEGPRGPAFVDAFAGRSAEQVSTMILPQVHLRKPCYDSPSSK